MKTFSAAELKDPRVEVVKFRRHNFEVGELQLFGVVGAKLCGRQLSPIAVVFTPDREMTVAVTDEIAVDSLHPFDPRIPAPLRDLIRDVVLAYALEVESAEWGDP
jgi:hypothetical protein